jgi:hypothetical protein
VSTLFVTEAQAGKRSYRRRRQDFGDDNDGNAPFQGFGNQGFSNSNANPNSNANAERAQPPNNTATPEADSDRRLTDGTRNADDDSPGGGRGSGRTADGERQRATAGPPNTVAEIFSRLFKSGKSAPHAMPSWPAAKVTRAAPDRRPVRPVFSPETSAAGGKLAQRVRKRTNKRATGGSIAKNILASPGTYREKELLVQRATTTVVAKLLARGWVEKPSAVQGVARFVSATQDP